MSNLARLDSATALISIGQREVTHAAARAAFFAKYPNGLESFADLPENWQSRVHDYHLTQRINAAISETAFLPAPDGIKY